MGEEYSKSLSPFDKHPSSSSGSSAMSDDISHLQKENNKSTKNQTPVASSMKEERKRLEKLNKKIDFIEDVRTTFAICFFVSSGVSTFLLGAPGEVFGMPMYSILLSIHFLSHSCLCVVHYKLLPPLINERSIQSYRVEGQGHYPPAYRLSNNEKIWCYVRILFSILINGGIWIYLSYRYLQVDWKIDSDREKIFSVCLVLGILLLTISSHTLLNLDHRYWKPEIKKGKTEQRKEVSYKRVILQTGDFLIAKDDLKAENLEEIAKLRNEMLEREKERDKILREKDEERDKIIMELSQEVKRLRGQRTTK